MIRSLIISPLLGLIAFATLATHPLTGVDIEEAPRTAAVLLSVGFSGVDTDGCECIYVPAALAPIVAGLASA